MQRDKRVGRQWRVQWTPRFPGGGEESAMKRPCKIIITETGHANFNWTMLKRESRNNRGIELNRVVYRIVAPLVHLFPMNQYIRTYFPENLFKFVQSSSRVFSDGYPTRIFISSFFVLIQN